MIIDTHCHLDFPEFNFDKQDVLERAKKSGVSSIINVGSSLAGSRRSVELAAEHKEIFVSIGIHPHYADSINEKILNEIRALLKKDKVVAVGEVGLDYYRNKSSREGQKTIQKLSGYSRRE